MRSEVSTPESVSHASLSCNSCKKIEGWGMQPLVPLVFIIYHPYIPLHLASYSEAKLGTLLVAL